MSEIDIPDRLERYGGEIEIERIALIESDTHHLPHFNLSDKRSDPRHNWFMKNYGHECWELDAMSPVDLRARVEWEIRSRIDEEAWGLAKKAEAAEIATIKKVTDSWKKLF